MSGAIPEKNEGWLVFLDMEDERPNAWFATEEDAEKFLKSVDHPEYGDYLSVTASFKIGHYQDGTIRVKEIKGE